MSEITIRAKHLEELIALVEDTLEANLALAFSCAHTRACARRRRRRSSSSVAAASAAVAPMQ